MNDPFDHLSFEEELDPSNWIEETGLHTPTFEAVLKADVSFDSINFAVPTNKFSLEC